MLERSSAGINHIIKLMQGSEMVLNSHTWPGLSSVELKEFDPDVLAETMPPNSDLLALAQFKTSRGFGYLHAAAQLSRLQLLERLLQSGVSTEDCSRFGSSALHEAIKHGNLQCAHTLLQYGAEVEAKISFLSSRHHTPLTLAAILGSVEMTELLLKFGANVWHRLPDDLFKTAAHLCATSPHAPLSQLVQHEPRLVFARNSHGRTPLFYAAFCACLSHIHSLINAGADLNATEMNGLTALHAAWISVAVHSIRTLATVYFADNPISTKVLQDPLGTLLASRIHPLELIKCMILLESSGMDLNAQTLDGHSPSTVAYVTLLTKFDCADGENREIFRSQRVDWSHAAHYPRQSSRLISCR
jgi:ankyrin repeat protein